MLTWVTKPMYPCLGLMVPMRLCESSQLGRPDFATCKIWWKHIAQCLNLASHFTSSKTPIFNKGFACTNVHWNLYIVFIAVHYVLCCILPCAEHVQHLKSGHMQNFWFYLNFVVSIYHHATLGKWQMDIRFIVLQCEIWVASYDPLVQD